MSLTTERNGDIMELTDASHLFEASSRLDSAATILNKLSNGKAATPADRIILEWTGRFLNQVDWTAGSSAHSGSVAHLTVQATAVRPTFYAALIGIERRLREAGLKQEKEVTDFLRMLYRFLIKRGSQGKSKQFLPAEKLQLASAFLRELSKGLLVQLTDNGLPRENELLVGSTSF